MVIADYAKIFRIVGKREIIADTRTDEDLLYTGNFTEFFKKIALELMARVQGIAGRAAMPVSAGTICFPLSA